MAARPVALTLVMAWSPAEPLGHTGHRLTLTLVLDARGNPDGGAWPPATPWLARREAPGQPDLRGEVLHDEDGWALRFPAPGTPSGEAPLHRLLGGPGWWRPGGLVTIRAPDGGEVAWRVVGLD